MMNRSARIILAISIVGVIAAVSYLRVANHSARPVAKRQAVPETATSTPAVVTANPQPEKAVQGQSTATRAVSPKKTELAVKSLPTTAPPRGVGGLVAFKDPVTGQIRQPEASEIGELVGTPAANAPLRRSAVAPAAVAAPETVAGAASGVGVKLGDDNMSFMMVTKTPDGKLSEECVTGKKAAEQIAAGKSAKSRAAQQSKKTSEAKESSDEQ
jgi:hypothetical protein